MTLENVHIGMDVDGVLAATYDEVCRRVRNEMGVEVYPSDITERNPILPGTGKRLGAVIRHFVNNSNMTMETPPVKGAVSGMRALSERDATVTIVTHRNPDDFDETKQWLAKHDIPYDNFADQMDHDVPKSTIDVDVLVDDHPKHVLDAARNGQYGVLMVRHSNVSTVPNHERTYTTRESDIRTLAGNPELQWNQMADVITRICGDTSS